MSRIAILLALLAACSCSGGAGAAQRSQEPASLVALASSGAVVDLWQAATDQAAHAVVEALREQDQKHSVELVGTDLEELRIWHGQSVSLGLEADGQQYKWVVQSEPEWRRLAEVLPTAQGSLLPQHDWDSVEREWLLPVSRGSLLPDFALEGPVDVYLSEPTALQLFLPHASDAGTVQRVLLRQGAAVMVRGARSVRLRRGLDLPPISLSEFAGIVTADAQQQQPLGVMHLLAGVQQAAAAHWNVSHPNESLGLVALELQFSPRGAALLAAPTAHGTPQRLRVRRIKPAVIELLPRDAHGAGEVSSGGVQEGALALHSAAGAAPEGAWPLKSVHPMQLQAYERLLRQVVSSRLFKAAPAAPGQQQSIRVAHDVQLRLVDTEAEATTLLQMQLELARRPKQQAAAATAAGGKKGAAAEGPASSSGKAEGSSPAAGSKQKQGSAVQPAAAAVRQDLPDPHTLLSRGSTNKLGPHETWTATVQIKGDAQKGTLKFVPLLLQRLDAAHDTVQLAPFSLQSLLGVGNNTEVLVAS